MRSSCIFLLLAGLIALAIESCDSASLGKNNYELEEIKLLRELVESYKRGHAVREEGDGDNVPEGGDDQEQGDGADEGTENTADEAEEGGDDQEQGDGADEGTENTADEAEDEDNDPEEGDEDDQTTGDEADLNPNEDNDDEGNENNAASDGDDEGAQETPNADDNGPEESDEDDQPTDSDLNPSEDNDDGESENENDDDEEGETPADQDSESSPGPAEESNGREREGLRKDFEEFFAQSENKVIEKLSDILDALDATKLEEAMTKVDKLLDATEAMSADLNTYANFLETVNKHLRDGKNSLDDIANAIKAAIGKISIGEDITPPDNEESERQAKGEVGVPVARAVGGGPVEVGVPVARVVGGGPVEVGEPVARAVGDGPIDKRAQFLREIQLFNLIQKLKNAAKK